MREYPLSNKIYAKSDGDDKGKQRWNEEIYCCNNFSVISISVILLKLHELQTFKFLHST